MKKNKTVYGFFMFILFTTLFSLQSFADGLPTHSEIKDSLTEIVGEQIKNTPNKKKELRTIRGMVGEAVNILDGSIDNYEDFGRLMHEQWKIKKDLSRLVTTPKIDEIYNTALKAGAIGGKLCGAGGGGFMILFAKPEDHPRIKEKLKNLLLVPINFEMMGSQTIVYQPNFSSERNKD